MAGRFTFSKNEKLTNKKFIDGLFGPVSHVKQYPLRLNILPIKDESWITPAKVVIITSKRNFKKAVDRNYQKRVLRELYRAHKSELYKSMGNKKYALALMFSGKEKFSFIDLQKAMVSLTTKAVTYFSNLD